MEQPGEEITRGEGLRKKIKIIGVPMDLGQSKRGVDMGPSAMRYAGLSTRLVDLGYRVKDMGNVQVPVKESLDEKKVLSEIRNTCAAVYEAGRIAVADSIPVFIGGDHSIAIGSIGGVTHDAPAGLIWIDAHGDFNTMRTSTTGNIHGMSLAVVAGKGLPELVNIGRPGPKVVPKNIVMIGVRSLDEKEKRLLKRSKIRVFTMRDIDERGINRVTEEALRVLSGLDRIHVSLDMDCLDPMTAPGVGTPERGGLTYREAHLMMEIIADSERLSSMDIVEINPIIDQGNQTAKIAVELTASLFGKRIL
jgi:arginase